MTRRGKFPNISVYRNLGFPTLCHLNRSTERTGTFAWCVAFRGSQRALEVASCVIFARIISRIHLVLYFMVTCVNRNLSWIRATNYPFTLYRLADTDPKPRRVTCVVRWWQRLLSHDIFLIIFACNSCRII